MRNFYIGLMLFIISTNQVFSNISRIEQKFTYALMTSEQDITLEDTTIAISESIKGNVKFKSPGKALLLSTAFPGLGQIYVGKWQRALIY